MDNTQLTAAVDALWVVKPDETAYGRAARFVRRVLGQDSADVLAALGLDGAELPAKCEAGGYKRTSKNHQVMCA